MNVLITGGTGFIGSHTVVELLSVGHTPIIVDNLSNSDSKVLGGIRKITDKNVIFYENNYQDKSFLKKVFNRHKIEGVIHFAAFKAVGESVDNPLKYYDNNVAGLISLLKVMHQEKVHNLVFSSSCTVYGDTKSLAVSETTPTKPAKSPYGETKHIGETIIRDVTSSNPGFKSISLRYFNPIGAHPSAYIGELPKGVPTILVPFITQTVAGWHKNLTVFGNDYPTPDGTCIRDYVHVVDLAKAHITALDYISKLGDGQPETVNIGTGKGNSVLEVIKTFEKITGEKVPYTFGPRRPGDIVAMYATVDKAKKLLGWKSDKTLADALRDAWRWQQTLKEPLS